MKMKDKDDQDFEDMLKDQLAEKDVEIERQKAIVLSQTKLNGKMWQEGYFAGLRASNNGQNNELDFVI